MTAGRDFEEFYRDTHPRLWSFLVRTTGEPDSAEDVAQEAFVRLLGSRGASLPVDERRAYVFRIARNLVRDAARRRARERAAPPLDGGGAAATEPAEPMGRRAAAALAGLRERDRQLLWLAHAEGWRHADIAAALGIAAASVKVLLHRARKRFRDALGTEGAE
jgi:RNA polymerase sigma-70 factor (ECF subfamily)